MTAVADERRDVNGGHLEEDRLHRPPGEPGPEEAERSRDDLQAQRERQELAADLLRPRAERHPQADLPPALGRRRTLSTPYVPMAASSRAIAEKAAASSAGDRRATRLSAMRAVHRPEVGDRQLGIDRADDLPQRVPESLGPQAGAGHDEDVAVGAVDEGIVDGAQGIVLGERRLFDRADDADDAEGVGVGAFLRSLEHAAGRSRCLRANTAARRPRPRRRRASGRA